MTVQTRSSRTTTIIVVVLVALLAAVLALLLLGPEEAVEPEPSVEPSASPTPIPTEQALNEELLNSRLTVLLVGLDSNEAREERGETLNADALMLVSVAADQSEVALVSLPRDTVDIPLPDGSVWQRKINGLFAAEGIQALIGAMETLYEVPIDGYLMMNMDDVVTLVDAVDGVTVDPPTPLTDPQIQLQLEAGEQTLDGPTALSYVRTRVDQDYGRIGRQQEVIVDLVSRLTAEDADLDLAELVAGLDSLETDLPLEDLPTFVEIGRRAEDADVTGLVVGPPEMIVFEGDRGDGRGYVLVPDVEAIRAEVAALIPADE